jgi:hypothetical protein
VVAPDGGRVDRLLCAGRGGLSVGAGLSGF